MGLLMGERLSAAPPDVFDDYFEQDVKAVYLPRRGVIKACLPENKWNQLLNKFESANTACQVGNENARFDWATLAKLNKGGDGDGNGVEYNLESAEGCLYRQLEWTDGTKLKAKNVKADFEGLPRAVWTKFESDMKECYDWNGEFKSRKKREVGEEGEEMVEEEERKENAPLLNWARELLPRVKRTSEGGLRRRKRASAKRKKISKKNKGKKDKENKKKKSGKKSGKKKRRRGGSKGENSSKSSEKSGGSGLGQEVYNQLWCADLVVEKALRRCAMMKIQG